LPGRREGGAGNRTSAGILDKLGIWFWGVAQWKFIPVAIIIKFNFPCPLVGS